MIIMYQVIYKKTGQSCGGHGGYFVSHEDATAYLSKLANLTWEPQDHYEVKVAEVDCFPGRKVSVSGKILGFQFNKNSMGERTFVRTVTNIHRENGKYYGECEIMGQKIRVSAQNIIRRWYVEC